MMKTKAEGLPVWLTGKQEASPKRLAFLFKKTVYKT
jgi:hypothetical protein